MVGIGVEAKKNPGVRVLLQRLGTDVVRDMVDEDAWVDIMRFRVECLLREGKKVVVTGIRFPNELEAIRGFGVRLCGLSVLVLRMVIRIFRRLLWLCRVLILW